MGIIRTLVGGLLLGFTISGCVTTAPIPRMEFPLHEYESLPTEGTGIVSGQAFLRQRGGGVVTAASSTVSLFPVTTYSTEWITKEISGIALEAVDPRFNRWLLTVTADAEGRFRFENVPPVDCYLWVNISWEVFGSEYEKEGGTLIERVTVENDTEASIIMSTVRANRF